MAGAPPAGHVRSGRLRCCLACPDALLGCVLLPNRERTADGGAAGLRVVPLFRVSLISSFDSCSD